MRCNGGDRERRIRAECSDAGVHGGWLAGLAADKWGRKLPLLISVVWFALCDGAVTLAPTFTVVLTLRTLFGVGMGAEWTSGTTMAMESWPKRSRGLASGIRSFFDRLRRARRGCERRGRGARSRRHCAEAVLLVRVDRRGQRPRLRVHGQWRSAQRGRPARPERTDLQTLAREPAGSRGESKQLGPGGYLTVLGPVGPLGALGPLGPLGPIGGHGYAHDRNGNYVARDGKVVRTVDVPYEGGTRTYELVEKYTEQAARR